jgi:hypothetical protein
MDMVETVGSVSWFDSVGAAGSAADDRAVSLPDHGRRRVDHDPVPIGPMTTRSSR